MPSERKPTVFIILIIAEKYRQEPGVEPRVSRLTYERVTN